jgi:hypothetical protein
MPWWAILLIVVGAVAAVLTVFLGFIISASRMYGQDPDHE